MTNSIIRKFFCLLTVVTLSAFALPGIAGPQKTYSLLVRSSPTFDSTGVVPPVSVTVYIKNESPPLDANSNIGSFKFTLAGLSIIRLTNGTQTLAGPSCPSANCSLDPNDPQTVIVTNISTPIQAKAIFPVTFQVNSCGNGNVPAATTFVYNGSQINGTAFQGPKLDSDFFNGNPASTPSSSTTTIVCGQVTCAALFTAPVREPTFTCSSTSTDIDCVSGVRSGNKDGFCSNDDSVQYVVTNDLQLAAKRLHVEWFTQPTAVFAYKVNLPTSSYPKIAWQTVNGQPAFIPGAACNVQATDTSNPPTDLPVPKQLTTLAADVAVNDKKISVTSTAGLPTTGQFDIVIGPYLTGTIVTIERMTVTKVNTGNNTLTVTRGVGGTSMNFHPAFVGTTPTPVMSTPMGILPTSISSPYTAGDQYQMCIAQGPIPNSDGTFSFWIIDIGDGWSQP